MSVLDEFDELKTDEEKWKFVLENQDKGITVKLDNDDTFITVEDDDEGYGHFHEYLGCSYGAVALLKALNVKCEYV